MGTLLDDRLTGLSDSCAIGSSRTKSKLPELSEDERDVLDRFCRWTQDCSELFVSPFPILQDSLDFGSDCLALDSLISKGYLIQEQRLDGPQESYRVADWARALLDASKFEKPEPPEPPSRRIRGISI